MSKLDLKHNHMRALPRLVYSPSKSTYERKVSSRQLLVLQRAHSPTETSSQPHPRQRFANISYLSVPVSLTLHSSPRILTVDLPNPINLDFKMVGQETGLEIDARRIGPYIVHNGRLNGPKPPIRDTVSTDEGPPYVLGIFFSSIVIRQEDSRDLSHHVSS